MPYSEAPPKEPGCPIPANTPHAVSMTLPTWSANIAYEEGDSSLFEKINSGYPRFYVHGVIQKLCKLIEESYGREGEKATLFPSYEAAKRCRQFIYKFSKTKDIHVRIVRVAILDRAQISAVFYPESEAGSAKSYWQHTGEGISSRLAEFSIEALNISKPEISEKEQNRFVEERFGRNLDLSFAVEAKDALRRRIADKLSTSDINISDEDVYLYQTGMTSIFSTHRAMLQARGQLKSIVFGFPYVDTLQIQKKFGAGVHFFPRGSDEELEQIKELLESGEKILMLTCEFPSNPLLVAPNLAKIKELSQKYKFPIAVDETVGNFSNVNVLKYADVVVSSLTKVFSGDSNVMGGSLVLNPTGEFYKDIRAALKEQYEDLFWDEDAIYMERNSRDFSDRSQRINSNAEAVAELFRACPLVKDVFYPKFNPSKPNYDLCRNSNGGYGGLLSVVFEDPKNAPKFYDAVESAKGPSLGTNFTLTSPYVILAHYNELDYVKQFGVESHLIRISVGLEDQEELLSRFKKGLSVLG